MIGRPARGHRLPRGGNACDFCGASEIQSLYSCLNFEWEGVPIFRQPTGRWAACYACSRLVEGEEWGQLNRRVMREVRKRRETTEGELSLLLVSIKLLHAGFASSLVQGEALTVHLPLVRRICISR